MLLVSSGSRLYPIRWSQILSWEWRCSWSSADRRCSNYIWVINNLIAYLSASYIRYLTVMIGIPAPWGNELVTRLDKYHAETASEIVCVATLVKTHRIPNLKCLSSSLAVVFSQSIEAKCLFQNEYVVGTASTVVAPAISKWSTM